MVDSAANARSLGVAAAAKSEVIADVNATMARLTAEMMDLQTRCNQLTTQLAAQTALREVCLQPRKICSGPGARGIVPDELALQNAIS